MPENGWNEWSKFVLKEMERISGKQDTLESKIDKVYKELMEKINAVHTDLTIIKAKAIAYGSVAAFVITLIAQIILSYTK